MLANPLMSNYRISHSSHQWKASQRALSAATARPGCQRLEGNVSVVCTPSGFGQHCKEMHTSCFRNALLTVFSLGSSSLAVLQEAPTGA